MPDQHPRPQPWRFNENSEAPEGWFHIIDANGGGVCLLAHEPTAQLIVDLANADEIQRRRGWGTRKEKLGWRIDMAAVVLGPCASWEFREWWETSHRPTPAAALIAAEAWMKEGKDGK